MTRSTDDMVRNGQQFLIGKGKEIDLGVLGTDGSKIYEYILQQKNVFMCLCVCVCVCVHLIREAQERIFFIFC